MECDSMDRKDRVCKLGNSRMWTDWTGDSMDSMDRVDSSSMGCVDMDRVDSVEHSFQFRWSTYWTVGWLSIIIWSSTQKPNWLCFRAPSHVSEFDWKMSICVQCNDGGHHADTVTMVRGVDNYRVSPTDSHRQQHEQPIMTDRLYLCSSLERRMRHFCTDSCNFHQRNMWRSLATLSRTRNDHWVWKNPPIDGECDSLALCSPNVSKS